ncbi:MAG: SDR family NAD(P)-dependent oxidoreductase, partial [Myxococcota bacterium]
RAAERGIEAKPLKVSHAFHSPVFAGLDPEPWLAAIDVHAPGAVAVASGIADHPYRSRADAIDVFRRHATAPVRFGALLDQCHDLGADVYLQVGAGGPLAAFARKGAARDARFVGTLASTDDADGGRSTLEALGWLWVHGVALDPRPITAAATVASLPPIELPRELYWPVKDEVQLALRVDKAAPKAPGTPGTGASSTSAPSSAPSEAPAAEVAGADEVYDKVAGVVSKVSSYPRAALRPDLGLVDDLGFDSLMVADLATGLAEAFPALGGLPQELLLNRPTVQAIVDHVRTARSGGVSASDDDAPLLGYVPRWVPCPLPETHPPAPGALLGWTVLQLGERDAEITSALKHAGANVTRKAKAPVHAIVVIAPDEGPPTSAVYAGEIPAPNRAAALIRELDDQVRLGGSPAVIVMRSVSDPWSEGEAGVVRAVAREWPHRVAKVLSFDGIAPAFRAARLVQELVSEDRSVDVAWTADGRQVSGQAVAEPMPRWTPSPGDKVLVTGGTRGIGAKLAARLADAGVTVVVVGRGAADVDPRLVAVAADVTDRAALTRALAPHLPFAAVIHAAGVLADGPLGKVDPAEGDRAYRIKVDGFVNAIAAAGRPPVALALGSWAGRFGNRHQAWYGAANAQLAGFAAHPPRETRVVVAELGPWAGSEMVRSIPAAIQASMRAEGVDFASDTSGLDALWADLAGRSGVVIHGRRLPFWNRARDHRETVSTDSHPYLLDHAIDGVPVLPLAAACDLCAAAAGIHPPYEVRDLRLYTGITVSGPVALTVSVRGERVELRIGDRETLAYRATVRPVVDPPAIPSVPSAGGDAPKTTIEAFYRDVTFHRKMLQGLASIDGTGPDFVRGRVKTGRPIDWIPRTARTGWAVDPLALDSAFQMTALVAWDRYQRAGTPVSIGRVVVNAPLPPGPVRVDARFGPPQGDRSTASFVFRGPHDEPLIVVEDAVANLERKAGDEPVPFTIEPRWIDPSTWPEVRDLEMRLEAAAAIGVQNPYFHVHEGTARDTTVVAGRRLVNFSSYNYLGLSGDPRVLQAVKDAVDRYGTSVSASRVASGERPFHRELES